MKQCFEVPQSILLIGKPPPRHRKYKKIILMAAACQSRGIKCQFQNLAASIFEIYQLTSTFLSLLPHDFR